MSEVLLATMGKGANTTCVVCRQLIRPGDEINLLAINRRYRHAQCLPKTKKRDPATKKSVKNADPRKIRVFRAFGGRITLRP